VAADGFMITTLVETCAHCRHASITTGHTGAATTAADVHVTSAFYTSNRVVEGDKFWVKAVLAYGSASW
jgi:hypothetical protein